jgi:pimeloyl-ACP methyl ester carboxylesterase
MEIAVCRQKRARSAMEEDNEIAGLPRGAALALPGEARPIEVMAPDGVPIAAQSWGDPSKPAIVFVHGFGQCHLSFLKQVRGALARSFHLVTFDLRGHGASGKPLGERHYARATIWADDIAAVLDAARVETALFVGWSLGGRIAIDYLATHGTSRLAGLNLVGSSISDRPGLRGLGSARLRPLMMDADLSRNIAGTREFLRRWRDVPYVPLGQIVQKTAFRRNVTGVLDGFAKFYNVEKA